MSSNQSEIRSWKSVGEGAWRCAPWSVCLVTVRGIESAELWHDDEPAPVFRGASFDEAKAEARRREGAGQ